jgi:hypothetical protein
MVTRHKQIDWSNDLADSIWFHIGQYLTVHDIHRLTRTCFRLYKLFTSHHFWSYHVRREFGQQVWSRFIQHSDFLINIDENDIGQSCRKPCQSKIVYIQLKQRQRISLAHMSCLSFDGNRNCKLIADPSSLTGHVLAINDSLQLCYSLRIETLFRNMLPGRYDVIWRMKLDLPYMFGETEFVAITQQKLTGQIGFTRWTQEDFLAMYKCFNCDQTNTNLWFYQTMGMVEILGHQPCHVSVSMINEDAIHAKHGVFLDYVELKRRLE